MTSVNVTTTTNTVEVTTNGSTAVVAVPQTSVVSAITQGPQGPQGPAGPAFNIDSTAKVDKSVVYYDAAASQFKADTTWTTSTLTDGGNF
jgi:hypothetical protein